MTRQFKCKSSPRRLWRYFAVILAAIVLTVALKVDRGSAPTPRKDSISHQDLTEKAPPPTTVEDLDRRLNLAFLSIKGIGDPAKSRETLASLKAQLFAVRKEIAVDSIARWIHEGKNVSTGIEFSIETGKSLEGQPSLRVALLDWLLKLDPGSALSLSKEILEKPTDPDEWAVCLRNVAAASETGAERSYLISKAVDLIRNPTWTTHPSISYLESFDILSQTHATESIPLLSGIACETTPEGRVRAHAAMLTLDRLALAKPVETMRLLEESRELPRQRGRFVACLYARADAADPVQKSLVRSYLLNPARTQSELETFSAVFPNANFTVSKNLVSNNLSLTGAEIAARDAAALAAITEWTNDPAMERIRWVSDAIGQRLARFAKREPRAPAPEP